MRTSPDVSNPDGIERELFRICSFHSGYDICKSSNKNRYAGGSCVEVLFSKSVSKNDTSAKDLSSTNQVFIKMLL